MTAVRWRTILAVILGVLLGLGFAMWSGELGETVFVQGEGI